MPLKRRRLRRGLLFALAIVLSAPLASAAGPSKAECIAANESAQDLRHAGKLRAARSKLALCVAATCPGPVREDCGKSLTEVLGVLPTLVFEVKDQEHNDLAAVRVTMDGEVLAERLDGTAIEVDPGEHHFVFEADQMPTAEKDILVHEGDRDRHIRFLMGSSSPSTVPAEAPSPKKKGTPAATSSAGATQRTLGLIVGGVGAAGLVIGSVFGVLTKLTYDNALKNECSNDASTCSPQGGQDGKTAHTQAAISTVGFIGGAALLAGGALLYFTAPSRGIAVGPAVGTGGLGLRLKGTW